MGWPYQAIEAFFSQEKSHLQQFEQGYSGKLEIVALQLKQNDVKFGQGERKCKTSNPEEYTNLLRDI